MTDWKRKEWTTKGADPTVVVQWTYTDPQIPVVVEVTEFQNVYVSKMYVSGLKFEDYDQDTDPWYVERAKQMEREYWDAMDKGGDDGRVSQ